MSASAGQARRSCPHDFALVMRHADRELVEQLCVSIKKNIRPRVAIGDELKQRATAVQPRPPGATRASDQVSTARRRSFDAGPSRRAASATLASGRGHAAVATHPCAADCQARPPRGLSRTSSAMAAAATSGSSCSQTRTTRQPIASSAASFFRSRATFRSSFARQYGPLDVGDTPCSGHRCQKQPSTNTASRAAGNMTSARQRTSDPGRRFLKKRSPRRWSAERKATSGRVSRALLPFITART